MSTIPQEITRLQNAKAALKESIEAKGVTVASDATLDQYPALVDEIPQGGGDAAEKDVNFYDYDGTVLYSYTKQEFLTLAAMPDNPDRTSEGLTAQGWNWSLSDAKDFVPTMYGNSTLNIGQVYDVTDGKTKLFIDIPTAGSLVKMSIYTFSESTVDWGDGQSETFNGNTTLRHTYESTGQFVISITFNTSQECYINYDGGIFNQSNDALNLSCLRKAFISNGARVKSNIFSGCSKLNYVVFSSNTKYNQTGAYFKGCRELKHVTYPQRYATEATSSPRYDFYGCSNLKSVSHPKQSQVRLFFAEHQFENCFNLKFVTFQYLASGTRPIQTSCFDNCVNIRENTIDFSKITEIQGAAFKNVVLGDIDLTNVTGFSSDSFKYSLIQNASLPNPSSNTIPSNCFSYTGMTKVIIPEGVTTVQTYAFAYNLMLSEIYLPSTITSVTQAFVYCNYSLSKVTILATNPPSGNNPLAGSYQSGFTKIYVPAASVESYKSSAAWSGYANDIVAIQE